MKKIAGLMILMAGILWGCLGIFVRKLNTAGLQSMDIVALRAVVTAVVLFVVLLIWKRRLLYIKLKDIWCFLGTGICSIVFFNYCYFKSIQMSSLSVAAVLLYTAPAIVLVLSCILFHEQFTKRKFFSLIMTFVGCVLVTGLIGSETVMTWQGIVYGLGAGLGYALYSIFGRYAINHGYQTVTITFYTFFIAAVGTLLFTDYRVIINSVLSDVQNVGIYSILLGVVCTILPFLLYTFGLNEIENSKASIIASIEPVTATFLGIFVFHEKLTIGNSLGLLMVILAIVVCNRETSEVENRK